MRYNGATRVCAEVFTDKPTPHDNPLLYLENANLNLMLHIGGTRMRQARNTLANLERLATGQPLQQVILERRL